MQVSVSDAKTKLTDLVRRAEAGDDIILTRHGQPTVRLVPVSRIPPIDDDERWRRIKSMQGILKGKPGWEGVTGANAADFLYDEKGLPA